LQTLCGIVISRGLLPGQRLVEVLRLAVDECRRRNHDDTTIAALAAMADNIEHANNRVFEERA
jgi:hypothetical protein